MASRVPTMNYEPLMHTPRSRQLHMLRLGVALTIEDRYQEVIYLRHTRGTTDKATTKIARRGT
jgi:hypothetical protein